MSTTFLTRRMLIASLITGVLAAIGTFIAAALELNELQSYVVIGLCAAPVIPLLALWVEAPAMRARSQHDSTKR